MFRRLRRRWAHKSIRKFLREYLPDIGLGQLEEFKCQNFKFGKYSVKTTKGEYILHFWELLYSAKEFHIDLCEHKDGKWERITISITGNIFFKITPYEYTIDRVDKRQVTRLSDGETEIWPLGKDSHGCDDKCTVYRKPIMNSEFVDLTRVIGLTWNYS